MYYKYTNEDGEVEEDYKFDTENLEMFTPYSMVSMPAWMSEVGNAYSHIQSSMVEYLPISDSQAEG